jgi:hypothetical protein
MMTFPLKDPAMVIVLTLFILLAGVTAHLLITRDAVNKSL